MPEVIRLSLLETARLSDEKLLMRTHGDILASLEGPSDARVGRDSLILCAEAALSRNTRIRLISKPRQKVAAKL